MGIAVPVRVSVMPGRPDYPLPKYQTPGSAGMDVASVEAVTLAPGARALVPTGLKVAVPEGFEVQIRPRSGLALRHGITVLNAPGTIDSDYRGEVKVLLVNLGDAEVTLEAGTRVAQMVVASVCHAELHLVEGLDSTERGDGGFGHTGEV